jgi:putative lipoic acid-binding regulatory protein
VPFRSRVGRDLGFVAGRAHNPRMEIKSDNPEHGFQFPGTFELSAMGSAAMDLETVLPTLLLDAGIEVLHESVSWKHSSNGRYVSVRISFRAESRQQYDLAHQVLRDHPEVKWTL